MVIEGWAIFFYVDTVSVEWELTECALILGGQGRANDLGTKSTEDRT
jgi:hypothetical protein